MLGRNVQLTYQASDITMQRLFLICALLTLTACATTVPTIEEGWVPLAEWNYRVNNTNPIASFAESIQGARTYAGTVRTTCYHGKRYTRCTSYMR
jgi:hypothetical protein